MKWPKANEYTKYLGHGLLWTSKNVPSARRFNDFDFEIVLARRRGANFGDFNSQKCSDHAILARFWLPNRSRAQAWCKFCRLELPKVLGARQCLTISTSKSLSRAGVVQIFPHLEQPNLRTRPFLAPDFPRLATKLWKNTAFGAIPTRQTSLLYHICAITSLGWQIFSNNSQYSRKLDS